MSIKIDPDGHPMTPKAFAKTVVYEDLALIFDYWYERQEEALKDMTVREKNLVQDQMDKIQARFEKALGYEPSHRPPKDERHWG